MLFRKPRNTTDAALSWFKAHRVGDQGVIVHTRKPVPYAEVTGYYVPTLYEWGETEAARGCLRWLLSVQLAEGAFPAPDGPNSTRNPWLSIRLRPQVTTREDSSCL